MEINVEYKQIDCVKNLDIQYKEHFFKIVDYYGPQLPERLLLKAARIQCMILIIIVLIFTR